MSNQPALDAAYAEAVKCLTAMKQIVTAAETLGPAAEILGDAATKLLLEQFQRGQGALQESVAAMEKVYREARHALVMARQRLANKPQPVSVGKLSGVFAHDLLLKLARALRQPVEQWHDIGEKLRKGAGWAQPRA